jgi:uncharacterized protein (DUF58 family)
MMMRKMIDVKEREREREMRLLLVLDVGRYEHGASGVAEDTANTLVITLD